MIKRENMKNLLCISSLLVADSEAKSRRTQFNLVHLKAFQSAFRQPPNDSCLITEHSYDGRIS